MDPAGPNGIGQNAGTRREPSAGAAIGAPTGGADSDSGVSNGSAKPEQSDELFPAQRQYQYASAALEEPHSFQELFEFYQDADSVFSEGAMTEMMARFGQDPSSFLSALAEAEQTLQALIADNLGVSISLSCLPACQDALYNARDLDLMEQEHILLERIIAAYESGASSRTNMAEPADEDLVYILDYIPSIYVDLKYATEDNFTKTIIYDFTDASLRYGTIKKLAEVQEELLKEGYSLKIWDAYRPVSAQFKLWEVCPDSTYVANPNAGYSSHSKGSTVDVTMVMADGRQIAMPSGFDDFSSLAGRDYSDVPDEAAKNALMLESAMLSHGFIGYSAEWWHYSDSTSYPVIE